MRLRFDRDKNCISFDKGDLTTEKDFEEIASLVQYIHIARFGGEVSFTPANVKSICKEPNNHNVVLLEVCEKRIKWNFSEFHF